MIELGSVQFFGTIFQPNARWLCPKGHPNVSKLGVPLRNVEHMFCKKCRVRVDVKVDMYEIPRVWGGKKE